MPKNGSKLRINLSAIVYREDDGWLAHCLELDIVAEGKDGDDAIRSLISLCDLQIKVALEEGDLESIFRPAPPEIWKLFSLGKEKRTSEKKRTRSMDRFSTPVGRFEAREMALV
jgi:hypothetical protein